MFMYILTFISVGGAPGIPGIGKENACVCRVKGKLGVLSFAGGFEFPAVYAKSHGGGSGKAIFTLGRKRENRRTEVGTTQSERRSIALNMVRSCTGVRCVNVA